jgi:heterodisulfide reductase subunit B
MRAAYYPGCSLQGTARDYDDSIRLVCENLGIELSEISDWNCCGATAAHSIHSSAAFELAARNLNLAAEMPYRDMLVPCPMCFNRLMAARSAIRESDGDRNRSESVSSLPRIWDLTNFFASKVVLERVVKQVQYPLNGLKVVCYYGCMASRPPEVTRAPDFENPQSMDRIVNRLGATAIDWPFKTDCCGATLALSRRDMVLTLIKPLFEMARQVGAQAFVVSCQMCQANLDMFQIRVGQEMGASLSMPVYYFSELIGLAIGEGRIKKGLTRHITDPFSLLNEIGFLKDRGEAVA